MSDIVAIACPNSFLGSLGHVVDAHARLGEVFMTDANLGGYATMATRLRLVAPDGGDVRLAGGRRIAGDGALPPAADTLFVFLPAFQLVDSGKPDAVHEFAPLHRWLAAVAARGTPIGAVGAAVFHLAHAGLLDSGIASLPDGHVAAFRRAFPRIQIAPSDRVATTGSVLSCGDVEGGAGMVLRLFADAVSPAVAYGIARRSGSAATGDPLFAPVRDPIVAQAERWMRDHFSEPVSIGEIAGRLAITNQTLTRRFRAEYRETPRGHLQRLRVESAKAMLRHTPRSVAEIAALVGYADLPSFRILFTRMTGQSPSGYRRAMAGRGG